MEADPDTPASEWYQTVNPDHLSLQTRSVRSAGLSSFMSQALPPTLHSKTKFPPAQLYNQRVGRNESHVQRASLTTLVVHQ